MPLDVAPDRRAHLRPVVAASRLEVIDLAMHASGFRDADQFVDAFEQTVALTAHMRNVGTAVWRCGLHERGQLVGFRETARK